MTLATTLLLAALANASLAAQDPQPPQGNPPQTPPAPTPQQPASQQPPTHLPGLPPAARQASSGTRALTLEDVLKLAMQNNQGMQDLRLLVESTDTGIQEQLGFFDPIYFANASGGQSQRPVANRIQLGGGATGPTVITEVRSDSFSAGTGFRQTLMNGLSYQASVNSNYVYSQPSFSLNPEFSSNLGLTLTQPLLRGYGTTANKGALYQARNLSDEDRLTLEQQLLETALLTVQNYWNYVFTVAVVHTRQEAVAVAEDLLHINQRKKEAGVAIQLDVVTAESEVATRKQDLIVAETLRGDAEDLLRRSIYTFDDRTEWQDSIVPLTMPVVSASIAEDWEQVAAEALDRRPDVRAKMLDLKNRDISIVLAKDEKLPLLNLGASYGYNGLGSNFAKSYDPIEQQEFRDFTLALSLEVPIGNNTADARLQRAQIEKVRGLVQLHDLQNQVVQEVRTSLRDVTSGAERIAAAREARILEEERYQSLLRRFDVGMAIVFEVRQSQRDVLDKKDQENRAILDYQISLARLQRARGTLLSDYGLASVEPRPRSDGIFFE